MAAQPKPPSSLLLTVPIKAMPAQQGSASRTRSSKPSPTAVKLCEAVKRAERVSERESDRIHQLESAMEHMKRDFEERIAHLEAVIETLAETLDTGSAALFSTANAKDYNRVQSKACQKADVKRKEKDEFAVGKEHILNGILRNPLTPKTLENWDEQKRHDFLNIVYRDPGRKKEINELLLAGGDDTYRDVVGLGVGSSRTPKHLSTPRVAIKRTPTMDKENQWPKEVLHILETVSRPTRVVPNFFPEQRPKAMTTPSPRNRIAGREVRGGGYERRKPKITEDEFSDLDNEKDEF